MYPREIMKDIYRWLERPEIIIIHGARQTGKTTCLKLVETELQRQGKTFFYLTLENYDYLNLLNQNPENLFKIIGSILPEQDKVFVLIDEIQYLNDPTHFMKLVFDQFHDRIKIIATGSSSFYMDRKFKDSLVGRKQIFHLKPLSFREYLIFQQREDLAGLLKPGIAIENFNYYQSIPLVRQNELKKYYSDFICFGGYPGVVIERERDFKMRKLEDLINSYIKKDVLEARLNYPEKYMQILKLIAEKSGALFNQNQVGRLLGLSTTALNNYLYVMQKSFHIALIKPFYRNLRKEIRKMPKAFLPDTGLRNALLGNFSPIDIRLDRGYYFENLVFTHLYHHFEIDDIKFWRTQNMSEIDFVLPHKIALEAKLHAKLFNMKKYEYFLQQYPQFKLHVVLFNDHLQIGNRFFWNVMYL